ncbi:MAG: M20/M25/M40 family metallo-hydrolase [Promethearchaeota archaeon]
MSVKYLEEYEKEALKLLRKSLKIKSPSGMEHKASKLYIKFLKKNGFKVYPSKLGNVIGIKGHGHPVLLLSSHIDTIPIDMPYKETENEIFARGAVDCKPSWISMLYSVAKYNWEDLFNKYDKQGTIIIAGIVREEDSLIGIEEFFKTPFKPDFAIFGEPTKIDRICTGYRGRLWISIKCEVSSGHASSAWAYINPIDVILEFWNRIKSLDSDYLNNRQHSLINTNSLNYFNKMTITLTRIHGGKIANSIPDFCSADIDIRIPTSIQLNNLISKVEFIKKSIEDLFNIELKVEFKSKIPATITNSNNLLIHALRWAIFKTINKKAKILRKTGTTFMNLIKTNYEIPTIVYGPGDPKLEHTCYEKIEKKEFLNAIEIYNVFFPKFFELFFKK